MGDDLEERLRKLQKRLEAIEGAIPLASELVSLSQRLNIPLNLYQDQLERMVVLNGLSKKVPDLDKDEMSKAIIQVLLQRKDSNISHITSALSQARGKASRRIVAERLAKLEALGIVVHSMGRNNEKSYRLNIPG